ncbi:putative membrane-anchored protein [Chitinivorax tropicus]|uniref:Putative membrane-anchored protein n=1 Tax=Chitinivorax tropicus TaxID=714531 RepID=A0A840MMK3_9PROT|nr:DUF2167 domain-containing protein [Chitinivorax tropicus]MBB5018349.1 putative membrane-anchored protein [Chitinivorax tropicus]
MKSDLETWRHGTGTPPTASPWRRLILLVTLLSGAVPAQADTSREALLESIKLKLAAYKVARMASIAGPNQITILNQARFALPAGAVFIPKKEVQQMLQAMKMPTNDKTVGAILSADESQSWAMEIRYVPSGYIPESGIEEIKSPRFADDLKNALLQASAKQSSATRITFTEWISQPTYSMSAHCFEFAFKGMASYLENEPVLLSASLMMGREGFGAVSLHTEQTDAPVAQAAYRKIVDSWAFLPKKRYEDYSFLFDKKASGKSALAAFKDEPVDSADAEPAGVSGHGKLTVALGVMLIIGVFAAMRHFKSKL